MVPPVSPAADDPPDPVMAPSYEELVLREGRDRAFYRRFMREDISR
jgi:hypothetical protein